MTSEQPQSVHMLLLQEKKEKYIFFSGPMTWDPEKVSITFECIYAFLAVAISVLYHLPYQREKTNLVS